MTAATAFDRHTEPRRHRTAGHRTPPAGRPWLRAVGVVMVMLWLGACAFYALP